MKTNVNVDFNKMIGENKIHVYLMVIAMCVFGILLKVIAYAFAFVGAIIMFVLNCVGFIAEFVADHHKGWAESIKTFGSGMFEKIKNILSTCKGNWIGFWNFAGSVLAAIKKSWNEAWQCRKEIINDINVDAVVDDCTGVTIYDQGEVVVYVNEMQYPAAVA